MNKKLHDGPMIYPSKKYTSVFFHASLSALQWAADRAGQSYGVFVQGLQSGDEARIQEAYDAYRAERAQEKRSKPRTGD